MSAGNRSPEEIAQEVKDRLDLYDINIKFCRAVDRKDWDLLRSIFHSDAIDDHGEFYRGGIEGFIATLPSLNDHYERMMHSVIMAHFSIDGDRAEGESTFWCYEEYTDGRRQDYGGRYLDIFERRDGVWRISHRRMLMDWYDVRELGTESRKMVSTFGELGLNSLKDRSFEYLPALSRPWA